SIRLQNVNAEIIKILRSLRIEARPSSNQITHLFPERPMHLLEQNWPRVDSHLAQRAIQSHEALERFLRERSPLFNFLKDAFVNQIEELRHHGKGGDIPLLQGAQKLGRVQRLQVHYARAFHQRQKQIRHLRQHVKHGQYAEQRVGWA